MLSSKLKIVFLGIFFLLIGFSSDISLSIPPPPPFNCVISETGDAGWNQLDTYFNAYNDKANQRCAETVFFDPKMGGETYSITLKNRIIIDNNLDGDSDNDDANFIFGGSGSQVILDATTLTLGAGECAIQINNSTGVFIQDLEIHVKEAGKGVCGTGGWLANNVITKVIAPITVATPTNLTITTTSPKTTRGSFTDQADNEDGFYIERSKSTCAMATTFTRLPNNLNPATGTGGNVDFTDSGLDGETTYCYRAKAFKGATDSSPSNTVEVTTPKEGVPPPPGPEVDVSGGSGKSGGSDKGSTPGVDLNPPGGNSGGCSLNNISQAFSSGNFLIWIGMIIPLLYRFRKNNR